MPTAEPVAVDVVFGPYESTDVRGGLSVVLAEFSDGSIEFVMSYFADEITYQREDFLGKTRREIYWKQQGLDDYLRYRTRP